MIWRRRARRKVRLKWRSDSGPDWRIPLYLSRVLVMFLRPRGLIRGSGRIDELSDALQSEQVSFEINVPQGVTQPLTEFFVIDGADSPSISPVEAEGRTHRAAVTISEQHQIDAIVDRLRAADVSIVRLEVKRPTLEDTFLHLVGQSEGDS